MARAAVLLYFSVRLSFTSTTVSTRPLIGPYSTANTPNSTVLLTVGHAPSAAATSRVTKAVQTAAAMTRERMIVTTPTLTYSAPTAATVPRTAILTARSRTAATTTTITTAIRCREKHGRTARIASARYFASDSFPCMNFSSQRGCRYFSISLLPTTQICILL
jgi:L-lactate utilization protein LutC